MRVHHDWKRAEPKWRIPKTAVLDRLQDGDFPPSDRVFSRSVKLLFDFATVVYICAYKLVI